MLAFQNYYTKNIIINTLDCSHIASDDCTQFEAEAVGWLDWILIDEASAYKLFRIAKKEGTIQYGYRTWGTHARVL